MISISVNQLILMYACATLNVQDIVSAQPDSLQEIVITGMRPVYHLNSPAPVQTLQGRDLERLDGQSVADAVRYFAGV